MTRQRIAHVMTAAVVAILAAASAAPSAGAATTAPTGCQTDVFSTADPFAIRAGESRVVPLHATLCATSSLPVHPKVTTLPEHGTLTGPADTPLYTPYAGYTGPDRIGYTLVNELGESTEVTWHLGVVDGANQAASCTPLSMGAAPVRNTGPRTLSLTCLDLDLDPADLRVSVPPAHGTLEPVAVAPFVAVANSLAPIAAITRATIVYVPQTGYAGPDSFEITTDDGRVAGTATVKLDVIGGGTNTAPTCQLGATTTIVDEPIALMASCSDAEGDAASLTTTVAPAHGTLGAWRETSTPGVLTARYTPDSGFVGDDTLTVQGRDALGATGATISRTLAVKPAGTTLPPGPSIVCARVLGVTRNAPLTTSTTPCTTFDDAPVTLEIVGGPANGTAAILPSGALRYVPDENFVGADTFELRARSGSQTLDYTLLVAVSSRARTTILSGPAASSDDASPSFELSAEPGVTLTCGLTAGTAEPCADGTLNLSGVATGDHVLTVTATDAQGRVSKDTYRFAVTGGTGPGDGGGGGSGGGAGGGSGGGSGSGGTGGGSGGGSAAGGGLGAGGTGGGSGGGGGGSGGTGGGSGGSGASADGGSGGGAGASAASQAGAGDRTPPSGQRGSVTGTDGTTAPVPTRPRTVAAALATTFAAMPTRAEVLAGGGATMAFVSPKAGRIVVRWVATVPARAGRRARPVVVAAGTATAAADRAIALRVRLTPGGRALLRATRGAAAVRVTATFTPRGGRPTQRSRAVRLR